MHRWRERAEGLAITHQPPARLTVVAAGRTIFGSFGRFSFCRRQANPMSSRLFHARVYRWLAALSLAAYGSVGVFGHALHDLMPCSDSSCVALAAEEKCCCCDHEPAVTLADDVDADGPQFSGAGHDPDDCSLCVLLAKIKVGRHAPFSADVFVEHSYHAQAASDSLLPADLILSGAPRGPPLS